MARKRLVCYAHGRGDTWEAICVDLDLAVHGRSLIDVQQRLDHAVSTYIEDARKETPATASLLLNRRAPFAVRARYNLSFLVHSLLRRRGSDGDYKANFELPCPA